jgi:hypothetical protein
MNLHFAKELFRNKTLHDKKEKKKKKEARISCKEL